MKKKAVLLAVILFLFVQTYGFAQDQTVAETVLPQLLDAVPDPAGILGTVGSLYQENYAFNGMNYSAYLFPKPFSAEAFSESYRQAAALAGYSVEDDALDGYGMLRIFDAGKPDIAAQLLPEYQGYLLLMIPDGMNFILHDAVPEPMNTTELVEMGSHFIEAQDYQAAIRYLLKAAGIYLRSEAARQEAPTAEPILMPTATAEPTDALLIRNDPRTAQTYTVQNGDSCWSIAAQFGMDIQDFMRANDFSECNLLIGQEVVIPGEELYTPTPTPLPGAQQTYVVEAGDNCWSIAVNKFGVNFELFMAVNNLTECNILVGQEVVIPGADQQMPTMTPIPLDQYSSGQQIQYVVEMNDSYNDIAEKFNTTLVSIQQLNNVNVYTGFPQFGQVLTIAVNLVTPTPTPEMTATLEPGTLQP